MSKDILSENVNVHGLTLSARKKKSEVQLVQTAHPFSASQLTKPFPTDNDRHPPTNYRAANNACHKLREMIAGGIHIGVTPS